jgi:mono/diheme cytochrome c family protein
MRTFTGLLQCTTVFILAAGVVLVSLAPLAQAQAARTASDGVYTEAQAVRGRTLYQQKCAKCHGDALQGRTAPPLTGDSFLGVWGTQPLSELNAKIRNTMPADGQGTLKPADSADLVAYILQTGKFPSGRTELASEDAALKPVVLAPTNGKPRAAAASQMPEFPAFGNLAQVMRGILFPSSNIIFNVQLHDPGEKTQTGPVNTGNFSWTAWGGEIYAGWQLIDYAAVSIAESAPLMLTPGRRCENGKPVPVERPDWIKFTQELAEAGRVAYRASQTRNQEIVSDVTNQLADSCLHCHQVYRDKRGGRGLGDSSGHCTP